MVQSRPGSISPRWPSSALPTCGLCPHAGSQATVAGPVHVMMPKEEGKHVLPEAPMPSTGCSGYPALNL